MMVRLVKERRSSGDPVEQGLAPSQIQEFQALSAALSEGLGRLKQGKVDSELIPADVSGLKSLVESG